MCSSVAVAVACSSFSLYGFDFFEVQKPRAFLAIDGVPLDTHPSRIDVHSANEAYRFELSAPFDALSDLDHFSSGLILGIKKAPCISARGFRNSELVDRGLSRSILHHQARTHRAGYPGDLGVAAVGVGWSSCSYPYLYRRPKRASIRLFLEKTTSRRFRSSDYDGPAYIRQLLFNSRDD